MSRFPRIDRIAERHPDHALGRLWQWARGKRPRFRHLKQWAATHRHYAFKKSRRARYHAEQLRKRGHEGRARRARIRARRFADRGNHWLKIERAYRRENRRLRHRRRRNELPSGDLVTFDGKPHAGWIVRESLIPARKSGEWKGVSYSGYRTPEYSEELCRIMCGASTCPGRCAGRNTNHAKLIKPGGAADVTDSVGLSRWEAGHSYPTRHTLPFDLPHHSQSGQ